MERVAFLVFRFYSFSSDSFFPSLFLFRILTVIRILDEDMLVYIILIKNTVFWKDINVEYG